MKENDILIVGLGNPGSEYEMTRHNIGFLIADEMQRQWRFSSFLTKWDAEYSTAVIAGCKVHLVKPMTYMNRSGLAVAAFSRFYKIQAEKLLVIHDDLDMDSGRIKLVKGGGAGGHNGIRSIVQSLGANGFYRLKIGIGRPGKGNVHADFPVEKYVLSRFTEPEAEILGNRLDAVIDGLRIFITEGPAKAMNSLNSLK